MNAGAPSLDPSLGEMITAVRGQMLSFPPLEPRVLQPVVLRNHGYERFRQDGGGRFLFGGTRSLATDAETGDQERLHPLIQERLCAFARELYPQLRGVEPAARWTSVTACSCDGLPFTGPHPHRPGVLLCLGFGEHGLSLTAAAARVVAELFSPRSVSGARGVVPEQPP